VVKGRCSQVPKVLLIFTGGTIGMKIDPRTGGAVPALSGAELLAHDPALRELAELEIYEFGQYPGPHMTPARMWALSEVVETSLLRDDLDGAVVTHGTDTLEETAYLLDLRHTSPKPVAVVGAMRTVSEPGFDGPANLSAAIRTVLTPRAQGQGVFVVMNQVIHAASEATKTDSHQLETFQSPFFGPLGHVDIDRVLFGRRLLDRVVIETPRMEERVDLIQMHSGADSRFIDFARESGARGIVVEGTGRGNVTPGAVPGIQRARDAGIPVVIASRCLHGRVLDTYAYEGSGHDLRLRGVLLAGTMNAVKARIRLMLALGITSDESRVRELMEAGAY
jgi:L-asparaginase